MTEHNLPDKDDASWLDCQDTIRRALEQLPDHEYLLPLLCQIKNHPICLTSGQYKALKTLVKKLDGNRNC